MQHSALGERWVYDAVGDPVAIACFGRALRGEQTQADMELWEEGAVVGRRESLSGSASSGASVGGAGRRRGAQRSRAAG